MHGWHASGGARTPCSLARAAILGLQEGAPEQWEAVSDLDNFFQRVYTYYHERGLRCILASRILALVTLAFAICLTIFLAEVINWQGLRYDCLDDFSCSNVSFVRSNALHPPSLFTTLYFGPLLVLYWLWNLANFVLDLRPLLEMRSLFAEKLGTSDAELYNLTWDEIVVRIIELQRATRFCIVKEELTAHDVANRILRKDNYLVGMVNRGVLPLQPIPFVHLNLFTQTLEWNLYACIFDAMFDKSFRLRKAFVDDVRGLQRRFLLCGLLNLALAPFVAAFMLIFFFIKHAEEFHRRPLQAAASALTRDYTRHARWCMREFNELPHVFEARVAASGPDATAYVRHFPSPMLTLFARFVTFIVGSCAAVLCALALLNENILLFYRFGAAQPHGAHDHERGGYNLPFLLALFSSILAVSRSFDGLSNASTDAPAATVQPEVLMKSLSAQTHYMPHHWRGNAHKREVYVEFRRIYQYKILLLLQEVRRPADRAAHATASPTPPPGATPLPPRARCSARSPRRCCCASRCRRAPPRSSTSSTRSRRTSKASATSVRSRSSTSSGTATQGTARRRRAGPASARRTARWRRRTSRSARTTRRGATRAARAPRCSATSRAPRRRPLRRRRSPRAPHCRPSTRRRPTQTRASRRLTPPPPPRRPPPRPPRSAGTPRR